MNDKAEKLKGDLKQKGEIVLEWILTITFLVPVIYFVFKPLSEFLSMVEYTIKLGILKYFFK